MYFSIKLFGIWLLRCWSFLYILMVDPRRYVSCRYIPTFWRLNFYFIHSLVTSVSRCFTFWWRLYYLLFILLLVHFFVSHFFNTIIWRDYSLPHWKVLALLVENQLTVDIQLYFRTLNSVLWQIEMENR